MVILDEHGEMMMFLGEHGEMIVVLVILMAIMLVISDDVVY